MSIQTNELYAAVVPYIDDSKVWDLLSKRTALMNWLMGEGKKKQNGGVTIQVPIKLIANASSGFISGTNAVTSINPSIQLQYMTFNWKYYNYNVNFTLADETITGGAEEKIDFISEKVNGALSDSIRELSTAVHAATSGYAISGLKDVVAASGTAYGGLTNTDYTDSTSFLAKIDSITATPNYANINQMYNVIQGRMQKEMTGNDIMCLMNPATYGKFQSSVQNQQIFTSAKVFEAGSDGFHVNNCDVIMDSDVSGSQDGSTADNYCYIFPKEVMKLYYKFGFGSKSPFDGEVNMPNQPIRSIQHYMAMEFVCLNRRLVGNFTALVA